MESIKEKELITREYVLKLREWILKNQSAYFSKENEADHWSDFCYFKNSKTDREHLVLSNEVLLIDRDVRGIHCFVICRILWNKEPSKCKVQHLAIVVETSKLNHWRAGYYLLPKL